MMNYILVTLYLLCAALMTLLTGGGFVLTLIHLWYRRAPQRAIETPTEWPAVTVQLPIYNERYVVERLLSAVVTLDYPPNKLTVQLLDDSTDATSHVAAHHIERLRQQHTCTIQHIRRADRTGYKAGALSYGMTQSVTPYYAIFDADFIPPANFLKRLMPHLVNAPKIGMVQGRWGHLNSADSPLTGAQTLAIDAHFIIEQQARTRANLLLNFNGTGGIWRAACIQDAGGWRDDTLTEDFDLSYRAQLRGWRLMTVPDMVVPGELPRQLAAFKQQQYRWAKGSTQVLLRMGGRLWHTPSLTLPQRVMGTLHLAQYMPYPLLLLLPLLTPPLLLSGAMADLSLGFMTFSGIIPPLMYIISQAATGEGWMRRVRHLPALILFGTGIALNNTLAILSAISGQQSAFQRTPKQGNTSASTYTVRHNATLWGEWGMALYALWGAWLALSRVPVVSLYLLLSALSFATVATVGWAENRQLAHPHQELPAIGD